MCAAVVNGGCLNVCDCSCPEEDCGSIKFTPLEGKDHKYRHTFLSVYGRSWCILISIWEELVHSYQYGRLLVHSYEYGRLLVHSYQYGRLLASRFPRPTDQRWEDQTMMVYHSLMQPQH